MFCFEKELFSFSNYAGTFEVGALAFALSFPKLQTFSKILRFLPIE